MEIFIKAKLEDLTDLARLAHTIWFEYWGIILEKGQITYMVDKFQSENAMKNQIANENYSYYFINLNNQNAGYFGLTDKKDYLFLSKLYLLKDYRGKGLGHKAFDKIVQIAKDLNHNKIRLTVNKYNTNTIKAYEKWGFKTIDDVVTDIGDGYVMDDYIMEFKIK